MTEHNPGCGGGCCHFLFSPPLISILLPAWKVAHARRSPTEGRKRPAAGERRRQTHSACVCIPHINGFHQNKHTGRGSLTYLSFCSLCSPSPLFWSKISRNESNIIKTQSRHGEKTFPEETKFGSSVVFGAL